MELSNQKKLAKHIFRLLKVDELIIPIGRTNKGNLGIKFSQNSEEYEIMLDSIPLSTKDFLADDNNIELKKMMDKYLFDSVTFYSKTPLNLPKDLIEIVDDTDTEIDLGENGGLVRGTYPSLATAPKETKRRGRPAGSKNKAKA